MRYRILCKRILKWGFPTKGIELTRFELFEIFRVSQLWSTPIYPISVGSVRKFSEHKWDYGIRNFSVLDKLVRLCIYSQNRVFPLPWWYFPIRMKTFSQSAGQGSLYVYFNWSFLEVIFLMIYQNANKLKKFTATKYFILEVPGKNSFSPTDS